MVSKLFSALVFSAALLPGLASAIGVQGDTPGKSTRLSAPAPAAVESDTVLVEARLGAASSKGITLNGINLPFASERPIIHGPYGRLGIHDLKPGTTVRAAVSRHPEGRKVLEIWVLR
jgi:hypothetical protein